MSHDTTWKDFVQYHEAVSAKYQNGIPSAYFQILITGAVRAEALSRREYGVEIEERQNEYGAFIYGIRQKFGTQAHLSFAELIIGSIPARLILDCEPEIAASLKAQFSAVKNWGPKDEIEIDLDGSIPPADLLSWIKSSYTIGKQKVQARELEFDAMQDGAPVDENKLRKLIAFCDLEHRADEILSIIRPSLWIRRTLAGDIPRGQSKFGGVPDLPPSLAYPTADGKPLAFVAQINLAELRDTPLKSELPAHGVLYFFTMWGWHDLGETNTWDNPDRWRVLYHPDDTLPQETGVLPEMNGVNVYKEATLEFLPRIMLPDIATFNQSGWEEAEQTRYYELYDRFLYLQKLAFGDPEDQTAHWFRGYHESIQFNDIAKPGTRLLLQISYDDELGFQWDDGGRLYYFTSDDDLARRDFSNVHFEMESY